MAIWSAIELTAFFKVSEQKNLNNFQNTISHVKFPEKFESFIRIQVRVKALPENCADRKKHKKKLIVVYIIFFYFQPFLSNALTVTWILIKDLNFSENFTWDIVLSKLFRCFFLDILINAVSSLVSQISQNRGFYIFSA